MNNNGVAGVRLPQRGNVSVLSQRGKAGRGCGDAAELLIENPVLAKTHKSRGNLSCHINCGFIFYKTVFPWEVFLFSEVFVAI